MLACCCLFCIDDSDSTTFAGAPGTGFILACAASSSSYIVIGFVYYTVSTTFAGAPGTGFIFACAASSCSCSVIAFAGCATDTLALLLLLGVVSTLCSCFAAAASCSAIVSVLSTFVLDSGALIGPRPPGGAGGGLATRLSPFLGVGYLIGTGGRGMNLVVGLGTGAEGLGV